MLSLAPPARVAARKDISPTWSAGLPSAILAA
jgi:hypothetical protein